MLQLFGGFVPPLIIFLIKRESRFVRFHALQPLIWQASIAIVMMVAGCFMFLTMLLTIPQQPKNAEPPVFFFLTFGIIWLAAIGSFFINVILAIYFGIKANEGHWARYPVIGHLAAKWAGI